MVETLESLNHPVNWIILIYFLGFLFAVKKTRRMFIIFETIMKYNHLKLKWTWSFLVSFVMYGLCIGWPVYLPAMSFYINKYGRSE